ncbi:MAG: beta-ketoacyl synthase N-terminal-like domain-containing protein [Candidatus Omnitrophota bacterium]
MKRKRVAVTGIGVLSCLGIGKEQFWQGFLEGRKGFKTPSLFDASDLETKIAGEITDFDPKDILGKKGLVDLDRATTLLLSAIQFSLKDSGIDIADINELTTGISVGTTLASLSSLSEFDRKSIEEGPHFVNPSRFPNTVINSPASRAAIRFKVKGPNVTISTGFCAGLDALEYSLDCINFNRADRMISAAVEEMSLPAFFGFNKLGCHSGGISFSEGASSLVLEELSAGLAREVNIYAEVLGTGSSFYPFRLHKFHPEAKSLIEAMREALEDACLAPEEIGCLFADADSRRDADLAQTKAIKEVFGSHANELPVNSVTSIAGDSFSASGGLAMVAALGALARKEAGKIMISSSGPNGSSTVAIIASYN